MKNVMTVDVEDWFHLLELSTTPDLAAWDSLDSRVEANLHTLFDLFDEANVKVTCFFLGWVAERFPHLVREAQERGHEIACHGYAHRLVYAGSQRDFRDDVSQAKAILEDICGEEVVGYRAPGFSITKDTPWAFDVLAKAGFTYDSSVFPSARGHGGIVSANTWPHRIEAGGTSLVEFPITVSNFFNRKLCFFGGGYLRLFPYSLIDYMTSRVNNEGRPVLYYVHPREIDPAHPRLAMPLVRRFKSYVNLRTTLPKLRRLVQKQDFLPIRDWIAANPI